jgi:hypothetical protein
MPMKFLAQQLQLYAALLADGLNLYDLWTVTVGYS